ncbi:hypothetical protein SAMN04488587_1521 [Methanococcoides vulcani]|uniref:Uncharacterized protein n=1 Tax=Methanococcoides vulcani TaxID=1353158 RepID=A0A1I0AA52_9EURY|nr:hypothetical protein [Methanococcoides vulcani]SES91029.1 hypothetical protein SAMN04488587_1521 [Methanococcoides vulcani]
MTNRNEIMFGYCQEVIEKVSGLLVQSTPALMELAEIGDTEITFHRGNNIAVADKSVYVRVKTPFSCDLLCADTLAMLNVFVDTENFDDNTSLPAYECMRLLLNGILSLLIITPEQRDAQFHLAEYLASPEFQEGGMVKFLPDLSVDFENLVYYEESED